MKTNDFYGKYLRPLLENKIFTLILLLVVMVLVFTVWSEIIGYHFFKATTFRNILNSVVVTSFLTIGAGCLLISGEIDLSQSAVGAFGGLLLATAVSAWKLPWFFSILLTLLFCALLGALNALFVDKYRFHSFIGTLAMASMAKGLMYLFSSLGSATGIAANLAFADDALDYIGMGKIGAVPFGVLLMFLFFLIYGVLMSRTSFGMKVMLKGGNPIAARLAGISATAITYILFINSAVLGGVSGVINAARVGQGSLVALTTNQFTGITAAFIGGISFGGGTGNMGGAFIGLLILNTFQIGMGVVGVNPYWVSVFTGLILIVALTMDFVSQRSRRAGHV
ncbi:MAG: ABC transporter permease [Clostridiales Family XIII bacterium]|jgi:ribose/xylose/arabinose/galactoside ABC-type transport system permease subunit|nr:ABC transporter permease [Clostridiales Family XIII bacterium]